MSFQLCLSIFFGNYCLGTRLKTRNFWGQAWHLSWKSFHKSCLPVNGLYTWNIERCFRKRVFLLILLPPLITFISNEEKNIYKRIYPSPSSSKIHPIRLINARKIFRNIEWNWFRVKLFYNNNNITLFFKTRLIETSSIDPISSLGDKHLFPRGSERGIVQYSRIKSRRKKRFHANSHAATCSNFVANWSARNRWKGSPFPFSTSLSRGGSSFRRGRGYINPEAISFVSKLSRLLHGGKDIERFKASKLLSLHGDMKLSVLSWPTRWVEPLKTASTSRHSVLDFCAGNSASRA